MALLEYVEEVMIHVAAVSSIFLCQSISIIPGKRTNKVIAARFDQTYYNPRLSPRDENQGNLGEPANKKTPSGGESIFLAFCRGTETSKAVPERGTRDSTDPNHSLETGYLGSLYAGFPGTM
jgi:hypothetical protein